MRSGKTRCWKICAKSVSFFGNFLDKDMNQEKLPKFLGENRTYDPWRVSRPTHPHPLILAYMGCARRQKVLLG